MVEYTRIIIMPSYSSNSPGTYSVLIPADSTNVRFTIAAAGGGASYKNGDGFFWYNSGGDGRVGDFSISSRLYDYTLYFYLGTQGGTGVGSSGFGNAGSGGWSPIASGGRGYNTGGGGGGASGVYDSGLGRYIAIVGAGGGAGRFYNSYPAGLGIGGGATSGSISTRSGSNAGAGNSGGGGGGSTNGVLGSSGSGAPGRGYNGYGGNSAYYTQGGVSWYSPGYSNSGNGYYSLSFTYAPPRIQYFTLSPTQIVRGETINLSWSVIGAINSVSIETIGSVAYTGNTTASPINDTFYRLSAQGPGGTSIDTKFVDVLIPPTVTIVSDAINNTINKGESVQLTWTTTGDASSATLTPGIGTTNISGSATFSPTTTATYTISVSGNAGVDSDEITIIVNSPPEVELNGPLRVAYEESVNLSYRGVNVTDTFQLLVKYVYLDGTTTNYELIEELATGDLTEGNLISTPLYNNFGPYRIEYLLYAIGDGFLTDQDQFIVDVDIDQTPDVIDIPQSEDKVRDEEPVVTPDVEVTTEQILIDDIDIPVEIKAEYPIQVEIDNDGIWRNIREM